MEGSTQWSATPAVSVIVPVFNEEETIGQVLEDLLKVKAGFPSMEIIVVDDGSTDRTKESIEQFASSIRYVEHEKNSGKGAAIKTGVAEASGKVVVIQDADLEYAPSHIPDLAEPILLGKADVVYGSRLAGKCNGMCFSHYIGNLILSKTLSLLYAVRITDIMTGHKALSRRILSGIVLEEKGFSIEVELTSKILRASRKIAEIPIGYTYRKHGTSKIRYSDGLKSLFKILLYKIHS